MRASGSKPHARASRAPSEASLDASAQRRPAAEHATMLAGGVSSRSLPGSRSSPGKESLSSAGSALGSATGSHARCRSGARGSPRGPAAIQRAGTQTRYQGARPGSKAARASSTRSAHAPTREGRVAVVTSRIAPLRGDERRRHPSDCGGRLPLAPGHCKAELADPAGRPRALAATPSPCSTAPAGGGRRSRSSRPRARAGTRS